MQDLLTWLGSPAGSSLVGGVVVMYLLQVLKSAFGWAPGTNAIRKQLLALVVSVIGGLALWGATGDPFAWGVWAAKALEVFLGATALHAVIPAAAGGRSEESRTPGVVKP